MLRTLYNRSLRAALGNITLKAPSAKERIVAEQSGRLRKVDWEHIYAVCHGHGFQKQ